ncbi:helix-turn-helix domain-containing protein [Glutamicibacter sp.]|uniref:helix-turn-helix domain-containing protein n=1 Tax=Glutamicibacter sp. TaxID=1931995 RepID=UPI002FC7AC81
MRTKRRGYTVTDGLDALFEGRRATLTAPEVAEILGMTKQGVYHWLRDGVIPGYKVGTTWFILRDDLKETLRKGANTPRVKDTPAHLEEE